jgi:hypothetical protein
MSETDAFKEKYDTEKLKELFRPETTHSIVGSSAPTDYSYIAKILLHPLRDGRHRLLWLVLAPYLTTILGMSTEDAVETLTKYYEECNKLEPTDIDGYSIYYFVERAGREGIKPPKLDTIHEKDGDLYNLISGAL